jgi:hypothetical protein
MEAAGKRLGMLRKQHGQLEGCLEMQRRLQKSTAPSVLCVFAILTVRIQWSSLRLLSGNWSEVVLLKTAALGKWCP